ncbi:MAG: tyrosine-type recombinase/integrase [Rhodoplanes sp.]|nr:tyrosine-type recombinase/integrase [Rhodoplanes sp.]
MVGERGLSVATGRRRFACLRAFFRWLTEISTGAVLTETAGDRAVRNASCAGETPSVGGRTAKPSAGVGPKPGLSIEVDGVRGAGAGAGSSLSAGGGAEVEAGDRTGPDVDPGAAVGPGPAQNPTLLENPFKTFRLRLPRRKRLPRTLSRPEAAALMGSLRRSVPERPSPASGRTATAGLPRVSLSPGEAGFAIALQLMVATGIRVGELCRLRLDEVAPDGGALRIHGKGARDRMAYITDAALAAALARLRAERAAFAGADTVAVPLFVNRRGTPLRPQSIRARLRVRARDAGLSRRVTPHMLRHTAATLLIETGVDIRFVQRLLGHASIATTEIYTHVSDEALRTTLARADVLGALRPH